MITYTAPPSPPPDEDKDKEKEAVMYLLGLGYTLSKPPKLTWATTTIDFSNYPMGS